MKKIFPFLFLCGSTVFMSCVGNDSPAIDTSIMPAKSNTTPAATLPATTSSAPVNAVQEQQTTGNSKTISDTRPAEAMLSGKGLNPAHGQPGHRCDIAVGAPLNTPATNNISTGSKPAVTQTVSSAAPIQSGNNNGAVRLNPEHGKPGHDCSVQVGAALKN